MQKIAMALSRRALAEARSGLHQVISGTPRLESTKYLTSSKALKFVRDIKNDSIKSGYSGEDLLSVPLEGVKPQIIENPTKESKDAAIRYAIHMEKMRIPPPKYGVRMAMLKSFKGGTSDSAAYGFAARYTDPAESAHELSHVENLTHKKSIIFDPVLNENPQLPSGKNDAAYFKGFVDAAFMDGNAKSKEIGEHLKKAWDEAEKGNRQDVLQEYMANAKAYEKMYKHLGKEDADKHLATNLMSSVSYATSLAMKGGNKASLDLYEALMETPVAKGKGRPTTSYMGHMRNSLANGTGIHNRNYGAWHDKAEEITADRSRKLNAKFKAQAEAERKQAEMDLYRRQAEEKAEQARMEEYKRHADELNEKAKTDYATHLPVPVKSGPMWSNESVRPKKKGLPWWPFAAGAGAAGAAGAGIALSRKNKKKRLNKVASEEIHPHIKEMHKSFDNETAKKVATMIATSHEYKTPNIKAGLHFTKNYDWEEGRMPISDIQGINKPIIPEKVDALAEAIKKSGRVDPFVVVNQLDAIRPQTPGKKVLIDGHHRLEACKKLGINEVDVYRGKYTGGAHKDMDELKKVAAVYAISTAINKVAEETKSTERKKHYINKAMVAGMGIRAGATGLLVASRIQKNKGNLERAGTLKGLGIGIGLGAEALGAAGAIKELKDRGITLRDFGDLIKGKEGYGTLLNKIRQPKDDSNRGEQG